MFDVEWQSASIDFVPASAFRIGIHRVALNTSLCVAQQPGPGMDDEFGSPAF